MLLGWDTETYLISRGRLAPRMVCASFCNGTKRVVKRLDLVGQSVMDEVEGWVESEAIATTTFREYLKDPNVIIVGHNLAFDTVVQAVADPSLLPLIFQAYRDGRFRCTQIRQMLLDIRDGCFRFKYEDDGSCTPVRYGLADLAERYGLPSLDKSGDSYRLRYCELDGMPASEYPNAAYTYAATDAWTTRAVCFRQGGEEPVVNEREQVRAHFALQLCAVWGIRTDGAAVEELETQLLAEAETLKGKLREMGIFRADGTKDTKALMRLVEDAFGKQGLPVPKTEGGKTSTSGDTLNLSGDPLLQILSKDGGVLKLLSSFVPMLKGGTEVPLMCGYSPLVATGRCSSRNPVKRSKGQIPVGGNIQQLPRKTNVRPCFVPRPGFLFASVDYSVAELRGLAEIQFLLFGKSALKDCFDRDEDPHLVMAATLLGKSYEWCVEHKQDKEVKDARQFAKIPDFGLPGGLGAAAFVDFARSNYDTIITIERAHEVIALWHQTWPEMKPYFAWVSGCVGYAGGPMKAFVSERVRGDCGYTDACNNSFQAIIADVAKEAMWRVAFECYLGVRYNTGQPSPLKGSRPVAFLHDEILAEVPEWCAHEAAHRISDVMCDVMREYLKNVPAKAEPALMTRWYKGAEPVYLDGRLVLWYPKPAVQKTT